MPDQAAARPRYELTIYARRRKVNDALYQTVQGATPYVGQFALRVGNGIWGKPTTLELLAKGFKVFDQNKN